MRKRLGNRSLDYIRGEHESTHSQQEESFRMGKTLENIDFEFILSHLNERKFSL